MTDNTVSPNSTDVEHLIGLADQLSPEFPNAIDPVTGEFAEFMSEFVVEEPIVESGEPVVTDITYEPLQIRDSEVQTLVLSKPSELPFSFIGLDNYKGHFFLRHDSRHYVFELHAGIPLHITINNSNNRIIRIPTGIKLHLPMGITARIEPHPGLVEDRSILAVGYSYRSSVESPFDEEIFVTLINLGTGPFRVDPGAIIANMIVSY